MLKKSLILLCLAFLIVACNTTTSKEAKTDPVKQEIVKVEIADLISNTKVYAENKIEVNAIVNHVCQHGGKKMFLINKETEETIKIIPGKNMPAFNTDLVGHKVSVTGTIEKLVIDEAYLVEWESELIAAKETEEEADHSEGETAEEGEHKHAETGSKADQADQGTHEEGMKSIADLRKQIAESEQNFIVFYTVVCEKLETIETADKE